MKQEKSTNSNENGVIQEGRLTISSFAVSQDANHCSVLGESYMMTLSDQLLHINTRKIELD